MSRPAFAPIPRRIPPLEWRRPFLVWTPVAIVLAIGWPPLLLRGQPGLFELALIAGALTMALSVLSLGMAWALGRPPRSRRAVIRNILVSGAIVALTAPFVLFNLFSAVPTADGAPRQLGLDTGALYAMAPLALMLGVPIALFSAVVFSVVALVKPGPEAPP